MKRPVVLKIGGSSVGVPERFKNVVEVIRRHRADRHEVVVVASALSGVTNNLVEIGHPQLAQANRHQIFDWLFSRHRLHAAKVLSLKSRRVFDGILQQHLAAQERLIFMETCAHERARRDTLLALGERLSIHILSLALEDHGLASCAKDAAGLVTTDDNFGDAAVHLSFTTNQIRKWYDALPAGTIPVVTGFVGGTPEGETTTLGRGGSDYSAALFAASLQALRLERWTDVDGIYTNDPRLDRAAKRYEEIVLEDAVVWNHDGKLGMHPKALDPLLKARIPVYVRSIDHPDWPGTVIRPQRHELAATG